MNNMKRFDEIYEGLTILVLLILMCVKSHFDEVFNSYFEFFCRCYFYMWAAKWVIKLLILCYNQVIRFNRMNGKVVKYKKGEDVFFGTYQHHKDFKFKIEGSEECREFDVDDFRYVTVV